MSDITIYRSKLRITAISNTERGRKFLINTYVCGGTDLVPSYTCLREFEEELIISLKDNEITYDD